MSKHTQVNSMSSYVQTIILPASIEKCKFAADSRDRV